MIFFPKLVMKLLKNININKNENNLIEAKQTLNE